MNVEAFIRHCAANQWSKQMTYRALDMGHIKFAAICEHIPGLEWPSQNNSIDRQNYYESRRGTWSGAGRVALGKASEKARLLRIIWIEYNGTCTPSKQFYDENADRIVVSYSQAMRRYRSNRSVEEAFFGKRQKSAIGQKKGHWHTSSFQMQGKHHG